MNFGTLVKEKVLLEMTVQTFLYFPRFYGSYFLNLTMPQTIVENRSRMIKNSQNPRKYPDVTRVSRISAEKSAFLEIV